MYTYCAYPIGSTFVYLERVLLEGFSLSMLEKYLSIFKKTLGKSRYAKAKGGEKSNTLSILSVSSVAITTWQIKSMLSTGSIF